jgi:hypothetical protein
MKRISNFAAALGRSTLGPRINRCFLLGSALFGFTSINSQGQTDCTTLLDSGLYSKFAVANEVQYVQTNASGPVPNGSNAWGFVASIDLSTNLSSGAATLSIPGKGTKNMLRADSRHFVVAVITNSFANVLTAYPQGTYQFAISNNSWSVTLPVGTQLPSTPTLKNYLAAQSIDPTQDFTLVWDPLAGASQNDLISVDVRDLSNGTSILRSPKFGCAGDLAGSATTFLIPANALETNKSYVVQLLFLHFTTFDTNSLPYTELVSGTEAQTQVGISTSGASTAVTQPVILNLEWLAGGGVRFDVQTTPGKNLTVQFNPTAEDSADWTTLQTIPATTALTAFTNNVPSNSKTGFYRAFEN